MKRTLTLTALTLALALPVSAYGVDAYSDACETITVVGDGTFILKDIDGNTTEISGTTSVAAATYWIGYWAPDNNTPNASQKWDVRVEECPVTTTVPSTTTTEVPPSTTITTTLPPTTPPTTISTTTTSPSTTTTKPTTTTDPTTPPSTVPVTTVPPPSSTSSTSSSVVTVVSVPPTTLTEDPGAFEGADVLPNTGAEHVAFLVGGLLLLVVGAGLVRWVRP